jgi:glycosyltransferase involved in cell wall biosynthesis
MGPPNALDQVLDLADVLKGRQAPYHFALIGDGASRETLLTRMSREQLGFVSLLPRITKDQARTALESADICLFSLRPDPVFQFGISSNKLFDYMMAGRPIIFAASASNNPVAEAGAGLSVKPYLPEALDRAARKFASMPERERCEMGDRGKAYVLKNHNWEILGQHYESVLASACCRRPFAFDIQEHPR